MPLPLFPILAVAAGLVILFRKDVLTYAVALFLIGFGALGVAKFYGLPVEQIEMALHNFMGSLR